MVSDKLRDFRLIKKTGKDTPGECCESLSVNDRFKINKKSRQKAKLQIVPKTIYRERREKVRNLVVTELFECMMRNPADDLYWGEFLYRFERLIDNHILCTLHGDKMPKNTEFTSKISEFKDEVNYRLTVKFLTPHFFDKALVHPKPIAWLLTVVRNETLDWYDEYRRTANVMDDGGIGGIVSMDDPVGNEEDNIRLGDTIANPKTILHYHDDWKDYIDGLSQLVSEKEKSLSDEKRLAFRIDLMFYRPLSDRDITEIAARRNVPPKRIEREIDQIMEGLFAAYDQREHQLCLIRIRKENIKRMEWRLRELRANTNAKEPDIAKQETQIKRETRRLANLEKRTSKRPIGPSVHQIASLMSLKKVQEREVSQWMKRIKDSLIKERENVIKNKFNR